MGLTCSDTHKSPKCKHPIKRYSRSLEESFDSSCSVSFHTAEKQNVYFESKRKNEHRKVSSFSHPARLKYYDHKKKLRRKYRNKTIVSVADRDGTHQTVTISKLKVRSCQQIGFQKKRDGFAPTPDYSDMECTWAWTPTCTEAISSDDVSPISRRRSKICIEEKKSETSVSSRSPISCSKALIAKHCVTEKNQEKLITNGMFFWENAANMKLSDIVAIDESRSFQAPGELTTQLVTDEHDRTCSDDISCAIVALENNKHNQKGKSLISDDRTHVPEQTSPRRSRGDSTRNSLSSDWPPKTREKLNHLS